MKIRKDDDGEWECIGCGAGFMIKPFNQKKICWGVKSPTLAKS
jgi:hypothetical protein